MRVMEGGHDVPIPKIISRYSKSIINCAKAIPIVDRAYVYDNSIDNQPPALILRTHNGVISKTYADPGLQWIEAIKSSINKEHIETQSPR